MTFSESQEPILQSGFSFGGPLEKLVPNEILESHWVTRYPRQIPNTHEYWMMEAFLESLSSVGVSNPNPAVGCVIVGKDGKELSRGHTQTFRGRHAERVALEKVSHPRKLQGATAYVTLEPCSHSGYQPPCASLLISSGVQRVFIALTDPNPLVQGKGITALKKAGKEVHVGILKNEITAWNFPFLASQILRRPVVALKWAQTLDGQLADDGDTSRWISGNASRSYAHWLRQRYDSILVGAGTLLKDLPRLDVRNCISPHQAHPIPIILDPRGRCFEVDSGTQKKLNRSTFRDRRKFILVTTPQVLKQCRGSWIEKKREGLILTTKNRRITPDLVDRLSSETVSSWLGRPFQSVMVEGGPQTLSLFLKEKMGDILHVFVAPHLTGGTQNRIFLGRGLSEADPLSLISSSRLGRDILMEMVPSKTASRIFS